MGAWHLQTQSNKDMKAKGYKAELLEMLDIDESDLLPYLGHVALGAVGGLALLLGVMGVEGLESVSELPLLLLLSWGGGGILWGVWNSPLMKRLRHRWAESARNGDND